MSYWRGHKIVESQHGYYYADTKQFVKDNPNRECAECGKSNIKEGYDGCLGKLPGLMNACCGHGIDDHAYAQFLDGSTIHGTDAKFIMHVLKKS